ncbi:Cu(I)/Ag(I) efflux system protein CusF [Luteibacter rhizovicinus]|uniref:Cu(I)/Ag(I) efflux system protein CusF n=1 Tax=Luteibacter rhizovicinus TaxID=242606 RepID=A0A4R3YM85_9GAMM|nr:copper-binding protein [Luteibacter rhizovicinus]TCV93371.1 Cu(I)/Ag(I) efflux system protein CusF [Luteibacter rhizovicinus]
MKMHPTPFIVFAALLPVSVFAAPQNMSAMPGMSHDVAPVEAQGIGVVKAIDSAKGTVTLQHEAIASIHWPAMTMPFKVASPDMLKTIKVGDNVRFTLHPAGMNSMVTSIEPVRL